MREQDRPLVADPLVKPDRTLGRLGGEIRSLVTNADRHRGLLFFWRGAPLLPAHRTFRESTEGKLQTRSRRRNCGRRSATRPVILPTPPPTLRERACPGMSSF